MRHIDQNSAGFNLFIVPVVVCATLYIMWRRTHVASTWGALASYHSILPQHAKRPAPLKTVVAQMNPAHPARGIAVR